MKAKIAAATLGLGIVVGTLMGGVEASAAPQGGAAVSTARHYACDCATMVTTSDLNLRSGPGTGYDVLLVMPEGAKVQAALSPDLHQNGFVKVKYGDTFGWAYEQYLAEAGTTTGGGEEHISGTAVTTATVNFRSGPGTGYDVYYVIEEGAQVAVTDAIVNGFRQIFHAGNSGWVHDDYLSLEGMGGGGTTVGTGATNDYVNFREGPGTGYAVIEVLAPGTAVGFTDNVSNGFRLVYVNGVEGWIYDDYVTPPASLPNAPTTGTMTTTDYVNFRVGPSVDHSIMEVLSPGVEVEITDGVQNGFRYVSVDGTMGWIHVDYLG